MLVSKSTRETKLQVLYFAEDTIPYLIVIDLMIPDYQGADLCRRIHAAPDTHDIPIIMFTTGGLPDSEQICLDAGANYFLTNKAGFPQQLVWLASKILQP